MPYSSSEQEIYNFAKGALPRWFWAIPTVEDWIGGFVKVFDAARSTVQGWIDAAYITTATGVWLDQHAIDRDTRRQNGELDDALSSRLRTFEDVVNPAAVIAAADAALDAAAISAPGYPGLVETKIDGLYFRQNSDPVTYKGFLSRGYRMRSLRGSIIVILPYGTDEATRKSVHEAVRRKKAGGFAHVTERRLVP